MTSQETTTIFFPQETSGPTLQSHDWSAERETKKKRGSGGGRVTGRRWWRRWWCRGGWRFLSWFHFELCGRGVIRRIIGAARKWPRNSLFPLTTPLRLKDVGYTVLLQIIQWWRRLTEDIVTVSDLLWGFDTFLHVVWFCSEYLWVWDCGCVGKVMFLMFNRSNRQEYNQNWPKNR